MCYRCSICKEVSAPGTQRYLHIISRMVRDNNPNARKPMRSEIAKELIVCVDCNSWLRVAPLAMVIAKRGKKYNRKIAADNPKPGYGMHRRVYRRTV